MIGTIRTTGSYEEIIRTLVKQGNIVIIKLRDTERSWDSRLDDFEDGIKHVAMLDILNHGIVFSTLMYGPDRLIIRLICEPAYKTWGQEGQTVKVNKPEEKADFWELFL